MTRHSMTIATVLGFLAVAAGAFGAHALRQRLDADMLAVYQTAVRYQMWHALALLLTGLLLDRDRRPGLRVAAWGYLAGIVLFSGSLYALTLSGVKAWGAVTPFGGIAFLIGWAALATACRPHRVVSPSK